VAATERQRPRASRLLRRLLDIGATPARQAPSDSLCALMLAAAALPGMIPASAHAVEVEQAQLSFSHYAEGGRQFVRGPAVDLKRPDDLQVDTVRGGLRFRLDDRWKLGFDFSQDTWSGATPYISAPEAFTATSTGASLYVNSANNGGISSRVDRRTLKPLSLTSGRPAARVLNVMTSASPETRSEGRLSLGREWDEAALEVSGGLSDEPDFRSLSLGAQLRLDFNDKLTSLSIGASGTRSDIDARLGNVSDYIDYGMYRDAAHGPSIVSVAVPGTDGSGLATNDVESLHWRGQRKDRSLSLALTQVLDRSTVLSAGVTHARSEGFLENPHKLVTLAFADPATPAVFNYLFTPVFSVPEKRPDSRNQLTWNLRLAKYLPSIGAAAHVEYSHARDDWGVRADTIQARWIQQFGAWRVTPRVRYYTQTAADFYQPYFLFLQRYPRDGANNLDHSRIPLDAWSSDQRLSAFGAFSYGIVVSRRLFDDLQLEIGYEHYAHAGDLKWGGGGEDGFGDFRSERFSVGLSFALDGPAPAPASGDFHGGHDHASGHAHSRHAGGDAPAGVMNAHMTERAGDFMVAYSYVHDRQKGDMITGSRRAGDAEVLASCGQAGCPVRPAGMTMHMHMLHLMYAPTDDVSLMLMPQMMSMSMRNTALEGGFYTALGGHAHGAMDLSSHTTGRFGDTTAAVAVRVPAPARMNAHVTLGVSIPTGSVDHRMAHHGGDLMDFGMQTGSGTWDFLPSLTLTGTDGRWSWGGQLNAVLRPDRRNKSGYVLGDRFEATSWASWRAHERISLSVRGIYTAQGRVRGALRGDNAVVDALGNTSYVHALHNPADLAANTGGRYLDVGIGASVLLPGREASGDRVAIEWIAPVSEKVNGYQLERTGRLSVHWGMMF
jgi:hypothetical protein